MEILYPSDRKKEKGTAPLIPNWRLSVKHPRGYHLSYSIPKNDQLQFLGATPHISLPTSLVPGSLSLWLQAAHEDTTWVIESHSLQDNGDVLAKDIRGKYAIAVLDGSFGFQRGSSAYV